jgi:hypothetical protein
MKILIALVLVIGLVFGQEDDIANEFEAATVPEITEEGCTCKGKCGATLDFAAYKRDWCYTENSCGHVTLSRFSHYDWCIYPEDREAEAVAPATKLDKLWELIREDLTPGPDNAGTGALTESILTSFDCHRDIMPEGREKQIHARGVIAKVKFVSNGHNPYTGLLSGADYGLLRLSNAKPIDKHGITPGFGLKFLRQGKESVNLVAMPSLTGQSDFNIGVFNYSNHVQSPGSNIALKLVQAKFTQASNCPLMVGLKDFTAYTQDGKAVSSPKDAYMLTFKPLFNTKSTAFDFEAFVTQMAKIREGPLFDVFAYASPEAFDNGHAQHIGAIHTTSRFTPSKFSDSRLMIRHQYMEDDFAAHPEWLSI